ncbi:hypothetical protein CEUSTIGMA_g8612.t1 [Chlamydomonas eustigma]|uniref:Aldose 1-epimerase n=1 Tax=Chlamydomonas eustigma TaxID=1157962 RepID=A0A250XE42_9CHLO|nr:hypothetical protein CEUSTIGMA_g8612.t1 [Chlamydomonas eustigma]|eukprot:GAX81179.1 hypothetical protein CEUSTIGMA_g8612.t1 [Chlamydomonas eustigma]
MRKRPLIAALAASSVGAALCAAGFLALKLKWIRRGLLPLASPVSAPIRSLQSMVSRKVLSWSDSLPIYTLRNDKGMEVVVSSLGATIIKMIVPDSKGRKADVVLGYNDVESYLKTEPCTYFGAIVGRCANRIAGATFSVGGETYNLHSNNGPNALHGGPLGLHRRCWSGRASEDDSCSMVTLTYESPHGEEGYPGNLFVTVQYTLMKDRNELTTVITATTDMPTPVNIVQHTYFNLGGHASGTILGHELTIHSGDHYTPVKSDQIPTGQILPVAATPFDFTKAHAVGERLSEVEGGYDHNYVLFNMGREAKTIVKKGMASEDAQLAATLTDPKSGRTLQLWTNAPGMQFYSGNFLDGATGKGQSSYVKHAGLCLETQAFPDSVNQSEFPLMRSQEISPSNLKKE